MTDLVPPVYRPNHPNPPGLMSDEDFDLFVGNWPDESAAQLRAMPYPHDWNFVVSSMAEWWVTLSPQTIAMLARVFPSPLCEHSELPERAPCEYCTAYPNCPVKQGALDA